MRRLKSPIGVIPRGFADHRRADARRYREYCLAIQEQYGPLPAIALPSLREAGRVAVELESMAGDLQEAHKRKQRRAASRIRRQQFAHREQLARLERRLAELAPAKRNRGLKDVVRAR